VQSLTKYMSFYSCFVGKGTNNKISVFQGKQEGGPVVLMTNALRGGVCHMSWLFLKMALGSVYVS
jgi:hypothetical protein